MNKESYIRVRLTKEEREQIGVLANAMGMGISEMVRRAIVNLSKKVKTADKVEAAK